MVGRRCDRMFCRWCMVIGMVRCHLGKQHMGMGNIGTEPMGKGHKA